MIKVLPFSALKRHLQGEIFTPVDMGAHYELQSAARVMCGSNGNTYRFKTAENAALWLDTNTIKAVKNQITKQSAIDSLIIKNMAAPSDWLAEEIATLQARANGDWAAFHTGEDLLNEWGIIAKGDKGDKGEAGNAGVNGLNGENGVTWGATASCNNIVNQRVVVPHGLGRRPNGAEVWAESLYVNGALPIGTKFKLNTSHLNFEYMMRDTDVILMTTHAAANLNYTFLLPATLSTVNYGVANLKFVVKPYILG